MAHEKREVKRKGKTEVDAAIFNEFLTIIHEFFSEFISRATHTRWLYIFLASPSPYIFSFTSLIKAG